jgi:predicted RNA-binding protein (virulence factor B family)
LPQTITSTDFHGLAWEITAIGANSSRMFRVGQINQLKINRQTDFGMYLGGTDDGHAEHEVLLPNRYIPEDKGIGDMVDVFVYHDSEDRLIATTEKPKAQVGEFAFLDVIDTSRVGAFLDWGLSKDLLLPFAEQTFEPEIGRKLIVFVYLDITGRISASMKLEKHLKSTPIDYAPEQAVDLLVYGKTDLGYKALINGKHSGMIFANEVFQPLHYGELLKGFIKAVREDGKIDLRLMKAGHKAAQEDIEPKILELLTENGGFLAINDKTPSEKIYDLFGVSKKKYKIALGSLYKKRLITVDDEGIRIANK